MLLTVKGKRNKMLMVYDFFFAVQAFRRFVYTTLQLAAK